MMQNNKKTAIYTERCCIKPFEEADSVTPIYTPDVIVFTWTSSSERRQDTAAVKETDPNEDVTSEIPTDETTAVEEEEDNNA